jgi:four helix bundle protein
MANISSFRDLEVWQVAMELAVLIYRMTDTFRHSERYGLTAQIRRSAVSIPANIAEGHNRRVLRPFRNHVGIALGSQGELDTLVELAVRLQFATQGDALPSIQLIGRVGQMLSGLFRSLETRETKDSPN